MYIYFAASLSSQSSRDASPARLPPGMMNHGTPEKSPLVTHNNSGLGYRTEDVPSGMYGHNYVDTNGGVAPTRPQMGEYNHNSDANMRIAPNAGVPTSPLANMNAQPGQPKAPGAQGWQAPPPRYENLMSPEQREPSYSNIKSSELTTSQPRLQEQGYPNQNYPNQYSSNSYGIQQPRLDQYGNQVINNDWQSQGQNAIKTLPMDGMSSQPYHNNTVVSQHPQVPSGYPPSPYQQNPSQYNVPRPVNQHAPPITSPPAKQQEAPPPTSGPPRTNVLGIIPYNTVSAMINKPLTLFLEFSF